MSSLMDQLLYTYLLIFCCFTFVCIPGRAYDVFPSCKVGLMVQRGTTVKAAPRQPLSVGCPVKHCGNSLTVTWCKLLDTDKCEQIYNTENVEIKWNDKHDKDKLISFLTFKRISFHDDGLYRCCLKLHEHEDISHMINISVSDLHQGVKNVDNNADGSPSDAGDKDLSWLPYFSICVSIALPIVTLTVLILLDFCGWKRILAYNNTKGQEMSTNVIPDLPKKSAPSVLLQTHPSIFNGIPSPNNAERPLSQPPLMTCGNQPALASTAVESQVSGYLVYAVINHQQSGIPAREQHTSNKQNNSTLYSAINAS